MTYDSELLEYVIEEAYRMDPDLFQNEEDFEFARKSLETFCGVGGKPDPRMVLSMMNDRRYWKKRDGK